MPASSFQQQKLRVCEVCSAYLGLHDNDRRLADHFGGKLHLGFIQIREKLDQLKVCPRLSHAHHKPITTTILNELPLYLGIRWAENIPKKSHNVLRVFSPLIQYFILIRKLWLTSKREETRSA